jgi:hypothetical protein
MHRHLHINELYVFPTEGATIFPNATNDFAFLQIDCDLSLRVINDGQYHPSLRIS